MAPESHDNRPLDTWRICGQPVDTTKDGMGCDCDGRSRPRRKILTAEQAGDEE